MSENTKDILLFVGGVLAAASVMIMWLGMGAVI